ERHAAEVRGHRAVLHARLLVHAQPRWLTVAAQSRARGGADHQGHRSGVELHADRRPGDHCRPGQRWWQRHQGQDQEGQCRWSGGAAMTLLEELRSLDPREPGRWPLAVRAGAVAVAFLALSVLGIYMLVWNEQRPELQRRQEEEQKLRQEFREKHAKAVNL